MRMPRFRIRTLLMSIALLAVLLGGFQEYRRLKELSRNYSMQALLYNLNALTDHRKPIELQMRIPKPESPDSIGGVVTMMRRAEARETAIEIDKIQTRIFLYKNFEQIYSHAASYPWQTLPELLDPNTSLTEYPVIQGILNDLSQVTSPEPPALSSEKKGEKPLSSPTPRWLRDFNKPTAPPSNLRKNHPPSA